MDIKNSTVLIVGGSGGIGTACGKIFGQVGAQVILAARNTAKADETAKTINKNGGNACVIEVDVTDLASVSKMAREIDNELGKIDVLINAFGVGLIQPLLDINPDNAKEVLDVNVYGTFLVTQTVYRYMKTQRKGRIIMLPGILGKHTMKNTSIYAASKFAVTGFTKALVEEQRRAEVKFSLLYLGGVNTAFWDDDRIDIRVKKDKMLSPEEVAKAVYYAVNQPQQSVMNEIVLQPDSHQMV